MNIVWLGKREDKRGRIFYLTAHPIILNRRRPRKKKMAPAEDTKRVAEAVCCTVSVHRKISFL